MGFSSSGPFARLGKELGLVGGARDESALGGLAKFGDDKFGDDKDTLAKKLGKFPGADDPGMAARLRMALATMAEPQATAPAPAPMAPMQMSQPGQMSPEEQEASYRAYMEKQRALAAQFKGPAPQAAAYPQPGYGPGAMPPSIYQPYGMRKF